MINIYHKAVSVCGGVFLVKPGQVLSDKEQKRMNSGEWILSFIGAAALIMGAAAVLDKPKSIYKNRPEEKNPFEGKRVRFVPDENDPVNADGVRGHLEEIPGTQAVRSASFYERFVKRGMDLILSFATMIVLSPLLLLFCAAIFIDDPGPIFFTQKRLGKNKQYFALHKFRSMKMSTPHDVPTHMLENPETYLTRVGKFLRKMSLDELPQLWDIFIGNMSLVGPRPGLWNQDLLVARREDFNANDVMPGLTGWAQVNGRDELEIDEKAEFDGEYCSNVTFKMDATCILTTVANVLKHSGVVEGGTGAVEKHIEKRQKEIDGKRKHFK